MTNRRLIIDIHRRGGDDNDRTIEAHTRKVLGVLLSTRLLNSIRVTIKLRAGLPKDRRGDCAFRDFTKGSTARSKHYTIRLRRDLPLRQQLRTLTHELRHLEQMARGRLAVRTTYGVRGYFWRAPGQTGPATKFPILPGVGCETPWHLQPWEIEAMQTEERFHGPK
jgi:hypothetical protein